MAPLKGVDLANLAGIDPEPFPTSFEPNLNADETVERARWVRTSQVSDVDVCAKNPRAMCKRDLPICAVVGSRACQVSSYLLADKVQSQRGKKLDVL